MFNSKKAVSDTEKESPIESATEEVSPEATEEVTPQEPLRVDVFKFSFRHVQRTRDEKGVVTQVIPRSGEVHETAIGIDSQDAAKKIHAVHGEDIEFLGGSTVASAVLG